MLKTVLAGLGRIGWHMHLPNIMLHDGYLLSAVVDADKERLDEAK
jgi:predicted dehydrogenase